MPDRQNLLAFPSGPQGPPGSSGLQVLKIEIFTTPPRCSIVKHELQKISYATLVYVKMCQQVSPLNHWQVIKWNHVCQNVPVDPKILCLILCSAKGDNHSSFIEIRKIVVIWRIVVIHHLQVDITYNFLSNQWCFHLEITVITDLRAHAHARARDAWSPGPICEILMFHSICLLSSAISMSSGWFFRSQNGCGKKTAGSAGDYPEEEEEAGGEPRPEGQGGCQVQGKALKKWKITKYILSCQIITACIGCSQSQACWHLQARWEVCQGVPGPREGRDQVPKLDVLLIWAQKECFKLVAKNLLTLYELVAFVASRSERVKNYASVGDLCIIMVLSALGCCTLLSKFFESIIDSRGILNSLLNLCLAGWGVRLARRKITMFPKTPSSPFVMRIGGINQVKYNYVETFKIPPSHAPWPNRALVVPEFIFIGGRQYSGRLGGSAVSCGWHCAEN